jgi:hypothetical protein
VLCEFQYGCLALCGLAPVVVLRLFGDRVEVFPVSVPLSLSLGRCRLVASNLGRYKASYPLFNNKLSSLPLQVTMFVTYCREDRTIFVLTVVRYLSSGIQSLVVTVGFFYLPPSHPFQFVIVFIYHIFLFCPIV